MEAIRGRRELIGGLVVALFGAVAILEGYRLGTGSLAQMEPGFFPMVLGVVLVVLGLAMSRGETGTAEPVRPEWRGWACIVLGVVAFIGLGAAFGLIPATLACVCVSALGDRQTTVRDALLLALAVTVFGVLLFHVGLGINLPLLTRP